MERSEEGVVVRGRVEIDMRQPFRSVKEAVTLFGEKVLAGEIYANKLKEMQTKPSDGQHQSRIGAVTAELEETKQSLQKTREEGNLMAYCLQSLKQELEQTKRELQQLKGREYDQNQLLDPEIEELKFVENTAAIEVQNQENFEYQKKRSVKFASPPLLTRVIVSKDIVEDVKTSPSSGKKLKRKPLIPMIGGLFSKKKGSKENEMPKA